MLYTSYFANIKNLPSNCIPISICGKAPDWYKGLQYKKLAPKLKFFKEWKENKDNDFYVEHFQEEVLDTLNQYDVIGDLEDLIEKCEEIDEKLKMFLHIVNCPIWCNPHINIVLICYEKPEDFCHRHLVANWLTEYGCKCEEYIENKQMSLFN